MNEIMSKLISLTGSLKCNIHFLDNGAFWQIWSQCTTEIFFYSVLNTVLSTEGQLRYQPIILSKLIEKKEHIVEEIK